MGSARDSRRDFLRIGAVAGTGVLAVTFGGCASTNGGKAEHEEHAKGHEEEEVSPAEDLMREHGVLKRVLLVYGEAIRRIDAGEDLPPDPVLDAAKIIRNFVEEYHEKLEEDYLFP